MKIPDISREYRIFNIAFTFVLAIIAAAPFAISIDGVANSYLPISWKPPACVVHQLTEQVCKGDGLTRSVVALYHGKWAVSVDYNPVGSILVGLIFFQLILRVVPVLVQSSYWPWVDIGQLLLSVLFLNGRL